MICIVESTLLGLSSSEIKTKQNGSNNAVGYRKANFNLLVSILGQLHEEASPYLEKFNLIVLRSLDFGLVLRPTMKEYVNAYGYDYDDQDYDEIHIETFDLSFRLLFVIILFYIFAIIVFFAEIRINKFFKTADACRSTHEQRAERNLLQTQP